MTQTLRKRGKPGGSGLDPGAELMQRGDRVGAHHVGVEAGTGLGDPVLRAVIDEDDPEPLLVAPAPLEVVEQRPDVSTLWAGRPSRTPTRPDSRRAPTTG